MPAEARKRIGDRAVGLIDLDCQILTAENQTEKLVVFTATPGTEDAERPGIAGCYRQRRGRPHQVTDT